jgi:hypothetical protein
MPKNAETYKCEICNFKCSKKSNYNSHLLTAKHKIRTLTNEKMPNDKVLRLSIHECSCGKSYTHASSLWNHKQKCSEYKSQLDKSTNSSDSDLIVALIKQNNDFKNMILEQSKQMLDIAKNSQVINNNTTTNQSFNLNFFLNDTCKDAMSITDFLKNINVKLDELVYIGNHGYVSGMTKMIMDRLKTMDVTKRPIHCTDIKRETMYIKEDDGWSKDTEELAKLRKILSRISMTNYRTMPDWKTANPECEVMETQTYDFCYKMMRAILGDVEDEQLKLDNKIIKTLAKELFVNKTK